MARFGHRDTIIMGNWAMVQTLIKAIQFKSRIHLAILFPMLWRLSVSERASTLSNTTPTNLNPTSALTILENQPIGTIVVSFTATDPDANTTFSYSLIAGAGDGNNSSSPSNPMAL